MIKTELIRYISIYVQRYAVVGVEYIASYATEHRAFTIYADTLDKKWHDDNYGQ